MRELGNTEFLPTRAGGATIAEITTNTVYHVDFTLLPGFNKSLGTEWVQISILSSSSSAVFGFRIVGIDEAVPADITQPASEELSNVILVNSGNVVLPQLFSAPVCAKGVVIKKFAGSTTEDVLIACGY